MLKLSDITAFVETVRTEGGLSSGYNATRIANDAGLHLYAMHGWSFRESAAAQISLTQGQDHEDLPADVGEITASALSGTGRSLMWTTPEHMARLRDADSGISFNGHYAVISQPPQADPEQSLPAWRLELYPAVSGDSETLTLWYRREWPFVSDPDHVLAIRPHVEPLYMQLVRAFVVGGWSGSQDTTAPRLSEIENGSVFMAARRADARVQPHFGPPSGSAVSMAGGYGAGRYDEHLGGRISYTPS